MAGIKIKKKSKKADDASNTTAPEKSTLKSTKKKEKKPEPEKPKEPEPKVEEPTPEPVKQPEPEPEPVKEPEPAKQPEPAKEPEPEPEPTKEPEPEPTPAEEETHENTGNWDIKIPPPDCQTYEGEEGIVEVKCWQGDVLHVPKVVWIKGKWNQLTKGDRYDMISDDRHMWHKLIFKKPSKADSGLYTLKIISKKKEETVQFNLNVGPSRAKDNEIILGKGTLPAEEKSEEVDFRMRLRKKKKVEEENPEDKNIWVKLRNANTRDYDDIAFKHGISDLKAMLRRVAGIKKRGDKKLSCFAKKLPPHKHYMLDDKIVLECEVKDSKRDVKWALNGKILSEGKNCKIVQEGHVRKLIIDKAQLQHDATFTCAVGDEMTTCEVFIEEPPVTITSPLEDAECTDGESIVMECELSNPNGKVRLTKNGKPLERSHRIKTKRDGNKLQIVIDPTEIGDAGFYQVETNGDTSFAELIVAEKPAEITKAFSDLKVNIRDTAEFVCEVSDENVKGKWLKDGVEIDSTDERFKVSEIGCVRKLTIDNVQNSDQGEYSFEAEGHPACKLSAGLTATGFVSVEKKREAPKIYLSRTEDESICVKAGNTLKLSQTELKDSTTVVWKKGGKDDPNATEIEAEGQRLWATNSKEKGTSVFTLTKAEFNDMGYYTCIIGVLDEESNQINQTVIEYLIKVIDKPSPPRDVLISNITMDSCQIDWSPPEFDGHCEFRGYIVERKKAKSNRWIRLNAAPTEFHTFHAKRMVEGTKYQIRVVAVNDVGPSEPSDVSKEFVPIAPTSAITHLKVGKLTDESIELKWTEPDELGAGGLDAYIIEMLVYPDDEAGWHDAPCNPIDPKSLKVDLTKLETGKSYKFRICTENSAGRSEWAYIGPIICAEAVEDAKIMIPRNYNKKIKVLVGQPLKMIIPYQGMPKPKVEWTKDGKEVDAERFHIRTVRESTTLFCRQSDRWDTGIYHLSVKVGDQHAQADFDVAVIDIPSKPLKLKIADIVGCSVVLKWDTPKDCGDTELIGYQVEKRDVKSPKDEWYVCVEKVRHTNVQGDEALAKGPRHNTQINDLVLGNSYYFRVRAFNEVGLGDVAVTKDSATIAKEKSVYVKPALDPLDFRLKPEFTLPLSDRRVTQGYNGLLSCSLKGLPKPKLKWFKGKVELTDNPKYKTSFSEGIVQLEIRRAQMSEAGIYKLVAENELGSATCECQVSIREIS